MATTREVLGFEVGETVLIGQGCAFSGGYSFDTVTVHQDANSEGSQQSLKFNGSSYIRFNGKTAGSAADEMHIAVYREVTTAVQWYIRLYDSAAAAQAAVTWDTDGIIRIRRGAILGTILASASAPSTYAWHTLKIVWTCREAASGGRIQVFLDGSTTALLDTGAGVDCRQTTINDFLTVEIGQKGVSGVSYVDCFVWRSTGGIPDEPLYVYPDEPTSDGATLELTPSTGSTHYNLVAGAVDTGTYLETTTAGAEDHLGATGLNGSLDPSSIVAYKLYAYATGDGTLTNVRTLVNSNGTVGYGANQPVGSGTYSTVTDFHDVDPDTATDWVPADLTSALKGVEINT